MAANAATKCYRVVENLERLLAIEFMIGMQALFFRKPLKSSDTIETLSHDYRKTVSVLREDRILSADILKTITYLRNIIFDENKELLIV